MSKEMLSRRSEIDPMTGAKTRLMLASRLSRAMKNSEALYLFGLDIQGMNHFNDLYGMEDGDRLLMAVARHFRESFGIERMYRIGADELVIDLGHESYPEVPELFYDPHTHALRIGPADGSESGNFIKIGIRHCLVTLIPAFVAGGNPRKHHIYLSLGADLAMLLFEKSLLDAGVEGARSRFKLETNSLDQLKDFA